MVLGCPFCGGSDSSFWWRPRFPGTWQYITVGKIGYSQIYVKCQNMWKLLMFFSWQKGRKDVMKPRRISSKPRKQVSGNHESKLYDARHEKTDLKVCFLITRVKWPWVMSLTVMPAVYTNLPQEIYGLHKSWMNNQSTRLHYQVTRHRLHRLRVHVL